MSISVTNAQLFDAVPALSAIAGRDLPIKGSFAVARLITAVNDALRPAETIRQSIVKDHIVRNEEGQPVAPKDAPDRVLLTDEGILRQTELMGQTVELNITPIDIGVLGDLSLPPGVMMSIIWAFAV